MRCWWVFLVTACGRVAFDPRGDAGVPSSPDAPPDTVASNDLVVHLTMDSATNGVIPDVTGNGHDGTCTACPTPVTGMRGNALLFDGVDDLIAAPSSATLESLTSYTIAFWIQRDTTTSTTDCLVSKRYGTASGNSFQICEHTANGLFFSSFNGSTNTEYYTSQSFDATWHQLALTFDGTMERLYLDGTQIQEAPTMKYFDTGLILIGADIDDTTRIVEYQGLLDDIRIYRRVLDAAELAAL